MITKEKYILSNQEGNCYHFAANRYCLVDRGSLSTLSASSRPVTLILAHGLGLHKETWEPFLEDLELLQANNANPRESGIVTDAWSVDCPSHGDAAILNERKLLHDDTFHSSQEYAQSLMTLIEAPIFASVLPRRVILVGHSGGACAVSLVIRDCVRRWGVRNTPFYSFIIIESPVLTTPVCSLQERSDHWTFVGGLLSQFATRRRDKWNTVEEAHDWLSKRLPYKAWDPRALRRYVEYGLRPLPTAFYPTEQAGFTLKAHKSFEERPFASREEAPTAGAVLEEFHPLLPVHIILGQLSPFRPPDGVPLLTSRSGKNTFYASVADIPNVNHLVRSKSFAMNSRDSVLGSVKLTFSQLVQEAPEIAARAVLATLNVPQSLDRPGTVQAIHDLSR
ncbi:hypothetical protein ACEPAI_1407 [Sanghuangporus weigelae]